MINGLITTKHIFNDTPIELIHSINSPKLPYKINTANRTNPSKKLKKLIKEVLG